MGDYIKTFDLKEKKWIYSKFITYLHKDKAILGKYISITTSSNKTLVVSPSHFVARLIDSSKQVEHKNVEYVFAKNLKLDDYLISFDEAKTNSVNMDKIISIEYVSEYGAYAPLTESGNLLVNSVLASCYANTLFNDLAHYVLYPIIQLSKYFNFEFLFKLVPFDDLPEKLPEADDFNPFNNKMNINDSEDGVHWYAKFFYNLLPYIPFSSYLVYI